MYGASCTSRSHPSAVPTMRLTLMPPPYSRRPTGGAMTVRHVTFGNLGRDKNPHKTTKWLDRQAIQNLHAATPDWQAAVVLCEVNEGDDDDELKLVLNEFRGWRLYGRTTREPVLLSPDQPK